MKRVTTGLVLAVVLIALMIIRGPVMRMAYACIAFAAVGEMVRTLEAGGTRPVKWAPMLFAALAMPVYLLLGWQAMLPFFLLSATVGFSAVVLRGVVDTEAMWATILPMIYPGMMFALIFPMQDIASPLVSTVAMGLSLLAALLCDIFAWGVGKKWGRRQLTPAVSPRKTVEGAVGGLVGAALAAPVGVLLSRLIVLVAVSGEAAAETLPPMALLMLVTLVAGAFSQCGDLAASMVKRYCGIKDYGNFLPGHGGIMDRIDSVLFSLVICYIYFIFCMRTVVL